MTFRGFSESYSSMLHSAPIRYVAAASLAFSTLLFAQARHGSRAKPSASTPVVLPATPPTAQPAPTPALPLTPAQLPSQAPVVTFANGLLTVAAGNSSLNQILHDISRKTGLKITGGVVDERVFGQYGPAPAAQVLNTLLAGTSSNMLLVESDGTAPAELILTPRQGGASPPNPNAGAMDDNDQPEGSSSPVPSRAPISEGSFAPGVQPQGAQPQSPNGVKTPQQIYDELQRLRQQPPAKP